MKTECELLSDIQIAWDKAPVMIKLHAAPYMEPLLELLEQLIEKVN